MKGLVAGMALVVIGCSGGRGEDAAASDAGDGADAATATDAAPTPEAAATDDGGSAGDASQDAADASPLVTVTLTACPEGDYAAPVTIGGQTFSLVLDTGSTTLGVASSACTSCDGVTPVYQPGSTATDEHQTATSQYVTGSWSGEIYADTVSVAAGATASVDLVAIDQQSSFFQTIQCGQGVIGFAQPKAALPGTTGFFDQLVASGGVPDVFGLELCPTGGTLWLGGWDATALTAPLQYVPFSSSAYAAYYYVVGLASVAVMGTTVPIASGTYTDAIVDTGTNAFVVPTAAYQTITSSLVASPAFTQAFGATGGQQLFGAQGAADADITTSPGCATTTATRDELDAMLPALTLSFDGSPVATVTAHATQSYLMQAGPSTWCSVLAAVDPGPDFPFDSIVGTPVLQSSVVVFDRVNQRLAFAPHAACP
jgi:hypothetical protein